MKWFFYMIVFLYMFYRAVYCLKSKEISSISIDPNLSYVNGKYWEEGKRKTISCKASNKNQKVEWINPFGDVVKRLPSERVFAQEHFVQSPRVRIPALVLIFTRAIVKDTGVWECRSGNLTESISVCVIDPSEFVDTPTEVTVDSGRSITLTCQARGEPEPRLQWHKNGQVITDDDSSSKYRVMTKYNSQGFEGLLTITSLDGEDSGVYTCDAIQESPLVDDCSNTESLNITLHVNHRPSFKNGDEKEYVFAKENESANLICKADGYPTPTYRWFKNLGDMLYEFPEEQINLEENGSQAVLTLMGNETTFGQEYKCRASNPAGHAEQVFVVLETEKPKKPSEVGVYNATYNQIQFNVTWNEVMLFPITGVVIQYVKMESLIKKKVAAPREADWKKGDQIVADVDESDDVDDETLGVFVTLIDLDEETEYWVRLRATNDAGASPWSDPILVATTAKPEEETEEPQIVENMDEISVSASYSDATFYGIFFAGGILVVAVVCMFAMRMV